MATFYLIRHAEPDVTGVMLGQLDPPLSPVGVLQAEALAGLRVAIAWSSPLRRARETADRIGCLVTEIPELRELDLGAWTGRTWVQIQDEWPDDAARKLSDWLNIPAPQGEAWEPFLARVTIAWNGIRTGPTPAAIIAHQAVNAALLYLIEGRDPLLHSQQYGEVIELDLN